MICVCKKNYPPDPIRRGVRLQVTGYKLQVTSFKFQVTGFRVQVTGYRVQVTGFRVQGFPPEAGPPSAEKPVT